MPKEIHKLLLLAVALVSVVSLPALGQTAKPSDTLHEMAKKAGGKFVLRYRPNRSTIYANVEELAKRSDIIIIGRTLGHRPSLRPDGNFITKDYLVKVQEVIKGDLPDGGSIVVSLPGGAYQFPDGTLVAVMPIGQREAEDQRIYIFFLKAKKQNSVFQGYLLASETQGLFGLIDGHVEPTDSVAADPVVVKYRGRSAAEFLGQVHKAVPRKKK